MGFTVKIEGPESIYLGEEIIGMVEANLAAGGDARARSTQDLASVQIIGNLYTIDGGANSDTIKLFEWAQSPAEEVDKAYRKVTVEIITNGTIFRKIELPNAFVIGYNERYNAQTGYGEFVLSIRQKADKIVDVKIEGGMAATGAMAAMAGASAGASAGIAQAPQQSAMQKAVENAGKAAATAAMQKALNKVDPSGTAAAAINAGVKTE